MCAAALYKSYILKLLDKKNFDQVCRICISGKGHLRDIHCTRISKMMESCADIEVSEEDGLPSNICAACFHMITNFYSFKKKIERTDKILKGVLNDKLKQSDVTNMDEGELSEEDIPLAQRLTVKRTTKTKSKTVEKKEEAALFPDGPPPLIPLAPLTKSNVAEQPAQPVLLPPEDPPPLVPIKPSISMPAADKTPSNIENVEYQCSTCEEKFPNVATFKAHKLATCQGKPLQCTICKKEFQDRKKLINHLKGHTVTKDYACKICGSVYPTPSTMQVHLRSHTGERPFRCKICDKGFARAAGVMSHMKIHNDIKPHQCGECGRGFKLASNLRRHMLMHTGETPFQCDTCLRRFSQWDNMQSHVRTYHTNDRPYLCNVCGKSFVNSSRLNRHMWSHSGYKPHVCAVCSKSYANYIDLKNHERCHTGNNLEEFKKYACDVCGKKFLQRCRLERHRKFHDECACRSCDRKFSSKGMLRKHLLSKHGVGFMDDVECESDIDRLTCPKVEAVEEKFTVVHEELFDSDVKLKFENIYT